MNYKSCLIVLLGLGIPTVVGTTQETAPTPCFGIPSQTHYLHVESAGLALDYFERYISDPQEIFQWARKVFDKYKSETLPYRVQERGGVYSNKQLQAIGEYELRIIECRKCKEPIVEVSYQNPYLPVGLLISPTQQNSLTAALRKNREERLDASYWKDGVYVFEVPERGDRGH